MFVIGYWVRVEILYSYYSLHFLSFYPIFSLIFNFSVFYFAEYLRPYLNHSFQNVRERLGSILINIFEADLKFFDAPEPECPRIKDIIGEVIAKIQVLQTEEQTINRNGNFVRFSLKFEFTIHLFIQFLDNMDAESLELNSKNEEYDKAIRLFKTSRIHFFH